jgi:hypothetical protein
VSELTSVRPDGYDPQVESFIVKFEFEKQGQKMFTRKLSICSLSAVLGVLILGLAPVVAQTTATISGTVADTTGAIIPGASISALQVETRAVRSVVTDDQGRYNVPSLQPGTYEVSAELPGF